MKKKQVLGLGLDTPNTMNAAVNIVGSLRERERDYRKVTSSFNNLMKEYKRWLHLQSMRH